MTRRSRLRALLVEAFQDDTFRTFVDDEFEDAVPHIPWTRGVDAQAAAFVRWLRANNKIDSLWPSLREVRPNREEQIGKVEDEWRIPTNPIARPFTFTRDVPLVAKIIAGAVAVALGGFGVWKATRPAPSPPDIVRATYEIGCSSTTLQVFIKNEGQRSLSILGFTLSPVYDAVYPRVAAHVGEVPKYDPLVVSLGTMRVDSTSGPKLVEIAKQDKGLIEIPLDLAPPKPDTLYVHATRLCVRYALAEAPTCVPEWLVVLDASERGPHCKVITDDALAKDVAARLAAFEVPEDADAITLLATIRPEPTEALVLETFVKSKAEHVAVRLELLQVMSYLKGQPSLEALKRVEGDAKASVSERVRALLSHARRDPTYSQQDALRAWVSDAPADLATRALELLPHETLAAPCSTRIAKHRCEDAFLVMQCRAAAAAELGDVIATWEATCGK